MCIKINLKQTALARLFFFVICNDKFLSCVTASREAHLMLQTLTASLHFSWKFKHVVLNSNLWQSINSVGSDTEVRKESRLQNSGLQISISSVTLEEHPLVLRRIHTLFVH